MMKKSVLALVLVFILASMFLVIPASAGGNACDAVGYHGWMYGPAVRNEHAYGNGYFLGPMIGRMQSCYNEPPKAPYWAGN
jgi:hypothetical protein